MKHKFTAVMIGIAAFVLSTAGVQAGEINANEQSLISAVSQSFSYNGATYVVKSGYIAQGRAKLSEDGVDLSAAQAQGYVSQFQGSHQELVEEGYCDLVSGKPAGEEAATAEPAHSRKKSQSNKLLLKTILGKPEKIQESTTKDQKADTSEKSTKTENVTASPAPTTVKQQSDAWNKEEDLGTAVTFEEIDRKNASENKVTISGNGKNYTIQKKETKKQTGSSSKAADSDNFLSSLLHLKLLRIVYWVVLGITVLAAGLGVYYILRVKRRHHKKRGLRRGIAIGIGVCAGGWSFLLMTALALYFGVFNQDSIQRQLMESDYFLGVTGMIRETAQDQLKQGGYDTKIASEVFTLSSVYIEEKQYISKILNGQQDAQISTEGIDDALKTEVTGRSEAQNQDMINSLQKTYSSMLRFELGNIIYQSRSEFIGWFYRTCITAVILLLLLFMLACRVYSYPHKAARVMFVAILAAALCVTGGAAVARASGIVDQIQATPVYYLQFLQKYALWSMNVFMYVGCLGILAAVALLIWKRYLHTVYAE